MLLLNILLYFSFTRRRGNLTTSGLLIKKYRINKDITQATLAKGICSVSYLSKIESKNIAAHEEITNSLLLRLGLQVKRLTVEAENEYIRSLEKLYKKAVLYKAKNLKETDLEELSPSKIDFNNYSNYLLAQLYFFRISLTAKRKLEDLSIYLTEYKYLAKDLSLKQRYLYDVNQGLYHYYNNSIFDAISCLERSCLIFELIPLEEWEKADLYHILSIFHSRNENNSEAFYFSSKASSFYITNNIIEKNVDSHIIMGNSKQNLLDYESAVNYFSTAQKLAISNNLTQYAGMIYHNLGSLFAKQGNHDQAIEHYLKSLNLKETNKQYEKSLPTILSLVQEFMKEKNYTDARHWSQKGLALLKMFPKTKPDTAPDSYWFHFEVFLNFLEEGKSLKKSLIKAIKHFETKNDYRYAYKYSIYLGEFLYSSNQYKAASEAFKKAHDLLLMEKSIKLEEM